jgi:hypothetical protein
LLVTVCACSKKSSNKIARTPSVPSVSTPSVPIVLVSSDSAASVVAPDANVLDSANSVPSGHTYAGSFDLVSDTDIKLISCDGSEETGFDLVFEYRGKQKKLTGVQAGLALANGQQLGVIKYNSTLYKVMVYVDIDNNQLKFFIEDGLMPSENNLPPANRYIGRILMNAGQVF